MKTKSILVAVAMVMVAAVSNAQSLAVAKQGANVFKITYRNEDAGKVNLRIYKDDGSLVFNETLKDVKSFARPLNFKGMEQGEYRVELTNAAGKQVEKINYSLEPVVNNVHIAKLGDEAKFLLSMPGQGTEEINVRIFDGSNELVHAESKTITGGFAQVYNLKNFSGAFTFEVTDANGNTKTIRH